MFTGKFNQEKWLRHLEKNSPYSERCIFVVAPDVIADSHATIERYATYKETIRGLGYRVAFVAQDGQTLSELPKDYDALFIGGTTQFKYSDSVRELVSASKQNGKWVHMGRVNTLGRILYAKSIGCDSVDGTCIVFSPEVLIPKLTKWMEQEPEQIGLGI